MITSVIALIWPQLAAQKKYEFKTPGFPTPGFPRLDPEPPLTPGLPVELSGQPVVLCCEGRENIQNGNDFWLGRRFLERKHCDTIRNDVSRVL